VLAFATAALLQWRCRGPYCAMGVSLPEHNARNGDTLHVHRALRCTRKELFSSVYWEAMYPLCSHGTVVVLF
jgi:hypothetical protein